MIEYRSRRLRFTTALTVFLNCWWACAQGAPQPPDDGGFEADIQIVNPAQSVLIPPPNPSVVENPSSLLQEPRLPVAESPPFGPAPTAIPPQAELPTRLPMSGYHFDPGTMEDPRIGSSLAANGEEDGQGLLEAYGSQAAGLENAERLRAALSIQPGASMQPLWWEVAVTAPSPSEQSLYFGIQELIDGALLHSSRIKIISTDPAIRRTEVTEEIAQFNWRRFLETKYDDRSDPIGNTLTTGNNASRFLQQTATVEGGVRQKNELGGQLEISQNLQYQHSNSRFFVPNPQGTARLELQYTQPLMNGAGRAYNLSRVVLAEIQVGTADDQWYRDVQEHLSLVTEAYWGLYFARADYVQRQRLLVRAESVLATIQGREDFDTAQRQVLRVKSAISARQAELIRAAASIRNAESRLRLLVNDPALLQTAGAELTPIEIPQINPTIPQMGEALRTALVNRRDISQAIRDVRGAGVTSGVARNQLLPKLDLLVSSYLYGLEGSGDAYRAFGNQYADGRPGFMAGLVYEAPWGNQAAMARAERSRLEMTRAVAAFDWTVQQALTSVEIALREVETTQRETMARRQSLEAATHEAEYLEDRWKNIPGVDSSAVLLLEDLLESQTRVTDEERAVVKAQIDHAMAIIRLKREMGTLLRIQGAEACQP